MFEKGVTFAGNLHQGSRRSQQDCFGFVPPDDLGGDDRILLLVADGMGGYAGGDVASNAAVAAFVEGFFAREEIPIIERLKEATYDANERIYELIQGDASLEGMGTTLLAAYVEGAELHWVSVGDSPFYLYRNAEILRLNADHSMREEVEDKVASGELSKEEAAAYPDRNCLLSALNGHPIEMMDAPAQPYRLFREDLLIACSDGVLTLDPKRFRKAIEVTKSSPASEIVQRVLGDIRGRRREAQDNATVAVIKMGDWIEEISSEPEADSGSGQNLPVVPLKRERENRLILGQIASFSAGVPGSVGYRAEACSEDESILRRQETTPLHLDSPEFTGTGGDHGSKTFYFEAVGEGKCVIRYQRIFRGEVEEEHEIDVIVEAS